MFHCTAQGGLSSEMKHVLVMPGGVLLATESHLLVEKEGHIVTLTMNRPEARNAFGAEMLVRFADAWDLIDGDPEIRVAILTAAGGHFCAGSDLKAMAGPRAGHEGTPRFKTEPELPWKGL